MVQPRNIEVDPCIGDLKSGKIKRPKTITITTQVSGLLGPMSNTTVWTTQYEHEVPSYREDIVFKEGWLITGKKKDRVLPWYVARSHIKTINLVGGVLFNRKKYTKHRLYGSRNSYVDMVYEVVAKDSEGTEQTVLLEQERDADLWCVFTRVLLNKYLGVPEVTEMKVKAARNKHYPNFSLAKTIDLARENSLRLKYNLFRIIDAIAQGDKYRTHLESREKHELDMVKEWTEIVWDAISNTDCPKVWE